MALLERVLRRTSPLLIWHDEDNIESCCAPDLVARARAISAQMRGFGVGTGDIVVLMLPTSIALVACLLAAWGCRAAVCLAPHTIGGEPGRLSQLKLTAILDLLQPKLIVHDVHESLQQSVFYASGAALLGRAQLSVDGNTNRFPVTPVSDDVAVVQLTSGSTSLPKAVPLTHGQVLANVNGIVERAGVDAADHLVSWLPVHHDMGLSALTVCLQSHAALTLIPTERFVRSPVVWLQAISRQGATISPAPTFAYTLLAKMARRLNPLKIDLSTWRYAWIGAEPISARCLHEFEQVMRPFGLRPNVVQPAYGMAEAVVAVSGNGAGAPVRRLSIAGVLLRQSGRVRQVDAAAPDAMTLVSNGRPIQGAAIRVRRSDGAPTDADEQGHIWISGPFVAGAYVGGVDAERFRDGWFDTGDLGFLLDGELYISGRAKDVIIRGGVNTSPAHVEWVVEQLLDLRPAQVAAFSHMQGAYAQEEVVIVVGMRPPMADRPALIQRISIAAAREVGLTVDHVVFAAARQIPKTTSGKVQRGVVREMFLRQEFSSQTDVTI